MIPDKIYIGAVTLSSNSPSEEYLLPDWHLRPNTNVTNVEYIRKEALLEWAKEQKKWRIECDYEGTRYVSAIHALNHLIDKLNSM